MKSLLFVDDEPRVLQGLQRQLRNLRQEWDMRFAESGPAALECMATTPVDVVVADMVMPEMDGSELLTAVMQRYPCTVRLVLSGHSDRDAILRLVGPAHQYLSKPCSAEEVRDAIARALSLRDLLSSVQLKQLVSRIRSVPTLPALYTRLAAELKKDEPSLERVAEIISRDIGMAAKVLQLVNSAFFGLPQPAATVLDAVSYLGVTTIQALVLSLGVFSQFDQNILRQFSLGGLADHYWQTGVLARRIAEFEHCDPKVRDQCFLAGLLHDVGYAILAAGMPGLYARVLAETRQSGEDLCECERANLGGTHAEAGAYLLGLWGMSNPVVEAVALHHRPSASPGRGFSPLLAVHVANVLTGGQVFAHAGRPNSRIDLDWLAGQGFADRIEAWTEHCQATVDSYD